MTFGQAGDIPVPGDYLGLGYDQLAVYRPSLGEFLVLNPNGGPNGGMVPLNLGVGSSPDLSSLVPVPGGYDNATYFGPGPNHPANWMITEAAVYDPTTGVYTILGPNSTIETVTGFQPGDIPAPADYLGNGSTQAVVFRPSTGQFIEGTASTQGLVIATFGQSGDIPLAAPLSYRMPSSDPPSGTTGSGSTGSGTTGTGSGTTGSGTTGSGTTGSSTTGSGTSGNGATGGSTTGSGTTGSSTTGNGNSTGSGTTGSGTSGTGNGATPPPAQSPGSGVTKPGTGSHKKKTSKPKTKPVSHKHPAPHKKVKTVKHATAPKPKVHVVTHKLTKVVVKPASSSHTKSKADLVDLALENLHTNLRRTP